MFKKLVYIYIPQNDAIYEMTNNDWNKVNLLYGVPIKKSILNFTEKKLVEMKILFLK
ncbi:MAG: hypothetical protein ACOX3T_04670 [Bdellovibrionota bacterium]